MINLRLLLLATVLGNALRGQTPAAPMNPALELSAQVTVEDGQPMVVAKVLREEKPSMGVGVAFFVRRTFGEIKLGEDTTLDDGTAAIALPKGLPGSQQGTLSLRLQLTSPSEIAGVQKVLSIPAPAANLSKFNGEERTLWARKAPIPLLALLGVILALVWGAYALVIRELIHLKKGGFHAS
jgi:hypothetical protein